MNLSVLFSSFYPEYSVPQPIIRDERGPIERATDIIERSLEQNERRAEQLRQTIESAQQTLDETLVVIEALSNARVTIRDSDAAFRHKITLEMEDMQ